MKQSQLSPAGERFVLHWGEMGARWGVNRTVAQIHALLYLSERPLTAEAIAETLSVARSNVSVSLKELQAWKLVRPVPALGHRREHFEAVQDVWEMFRLILDMRKQREIDPTLEVLQQCAEAAQRDPHTEQRLKAMQEFFEAASAWYGSVRPLPAGVAKRLMRLGGRVRKILAVLLIGAGISLSPHPTLSPVGRAEAASFGEQVQTLVHTPGAEEQLRKLIKLGVAQYFRTRVFTPPRAAVGPPPASRRARLAVALRTLRNRQWSSAAFFPMGGARTSFSGQFSRARRAYFAVYPEGAGTPAFLPIDDLLDGDAGLRVNGVEYRLTLSPVLFDPPASKLVVRRAKDGERRELAIRRIFDSVYRHGAPLELGGKPLRVFFGQDVDDASGAPRACDHESVAVLLPEGPDYVTFLIPLESIPSDGTVGEFELRRDLRLGLRVQQGVLEAY